MALSEEAVNRAKQKSIEFLEFGVASMATSLGVALDDLTVDYIIPVSEDDDSYESYRSMKEMYINLSKLKV